MALKISGSTIVDDSRQIINAAKVGIGTTNPGVLLDAQHHTGSGAQGIIRNKATQANASSFIQAADSGITYIGLLKYGTGHAAYGALGAGDGALYANSGGGNDTNITIMADSSTGYINFATGGNTERLRIASDGKVGIGSTVLTSQLEIKRANVSGTYPNGNAKPSGASIWNDGGDIFTGRLFLQGHQLAANSSFLTGFNNEGTGLVLYDYSQSNYMQKWFKEAQTELYYNGTQRFRTTDAGVTIYEATDKVVRFTGGIGEIGDVTGFQAVSYTHLTLPTIYSV